MCKCVNFDIAQVVFVILYNVQFITVCLPIAWHGCSLSYYPAS